MISSLCKKATMSLVLAAALLLTAQKASAVTVDFDSLNASGGSLTGSTVSNYLASYGITVSNLTPGAGVYVADASGWGYLAVPSSPNIFAVWGPNAYGNSFTLNFSAPVDNFSFTRAGFIGANSPSGNILGDWSATAFSSTNAALGSVGEPIIASYGDIPMHTFTLGYTGISHITFNANAHGYAGQQMPLMDDFSFTSPVPEPSSLLLLGSGLAGFAGTAWLSARRRIRS